MKTKHYISGTVLAITLLLVGVWIRAPHAVYAAATITVNSTSDVTANDGECTLREAITNANNDADSTGGDCIAGNGADTINFNITGTADYNLTDRNSVVKNGYTIEPGSELPSISETLTIDGYSQPGSLANNAESPDPFNGTLLIEINGTSAGVNAYGLITGAESIEIRGLVINSFGAGGIGIGGNTQKVQGNYIGTDPEGLVAQPNEWGISITGSGGDNLLIGGLMASERNLVAGNADSGITPNNNSDGWTIQGNYVGLDKTGMAALPNCTSSDAGALSLDHSDNITVGGPQSTATNVISGNISFGIAPHNVDGLLIQNNLIGAAADGVTAVPNGGIGIGSSEVTNASILDNTISHNLGTGINIGNIASGLSSGFVIQNNKIQNNRLGGILTSSLTANVLIGGTTDGAANIITGNGGPGFTSVAIHAPLLSIHQVPEKISVLGNVIYNNTSTPSHPTDAPWADSGLAIDLMESEFDGSSFTTTQVGLTPNDTTDADTGPNNFTNFPVLNSAKQTGASLAVSYNLDAADSPSDTYRVEFFANDTADPSGYGEGQTYLGAVTSTNGNNKTATLTLPTGTNLTGKVLSATTTAVDNTTDSGFGATSEFSAVLAAEVISAATNNNGDSNSAGNLSETGQKVASTVLLGTILILSSLGLLRLARRKFAYKLTK